eukprot:6212351-Pleurochrysis_carterae.AAC.1
MNTLITLASRCACAMYDGVTRLWHDLAALSVVVRYFNTDMAQTGYSNQIVPESEMNSRMYSLWPLDWPDCAQPAATACLRYSATISATPCACSPKSKVQ